MNHFGELSVLTRIAQPDLAVITNIGTMHIENLGSREGILQAKLEILEGLRPGGRIIFNGDDTLLRPLAARYHAVCFGLSEGCDVRASRVCESAEGSKFTVHAFGKSFEAALSVPGLHNVLDALAAAAVGLLLGLSPEQIAEGLRSYAPLRQRVSHAAGMTIIDDCYNAGPESMRAALRVLAGTPTEGRRIAVLGGMLELGDFAPELHAGIGREAAKAADLLLAYGPCSESYVQGAHEAGLAGAQAFGGRHRARRGGKGDDSGPRLHRPERAGRKAACRRKAGRRAAVQGQPRHAYGAGACAPFENERTYGGIKMEPTLIWILVSVLGGFVLALLLGRVLVPALRALKAGQSIREVGPKWHQGKAGTPTMGGIVFILSSLLCIVTGWHAMRETGDYKHLLVLALALMFGLIGFADDFIKVKKKRNLGLTGLQKLVLQVLAACLFLAGMHFTNALTYDLYIPFVREPLVHIPPLVYLALSVFIIVGCVNAVNLTDGIDGLATGVTLPVMLFFTLVSMTAKQWGLATFPATLVGALGGFLFYNFYPAKTFMGDTGSLYLGGAVCGLAYALDMPLVLLFVGLIYIIETLSDILQVSYFKLTHGKRIFKMAPIHHHFEMCGWSEKKIWVVFVSVTVIMCVIAWFGVRIWF